MDDTTPEPTCENAEPAQEPMPVVNYIDIDDFAKVELKTAEVVAVEDHPNADRLLVLTVRLGDEERTICAGIKQWYAAEDLVGKTVLIVANLKPRKLRGVESHGMMLAVGDGKDDDVVPLTVMKPVRSGLSVS